MMRKKIIKNKTNKKINLASESVDEVVVFNWLNDVGCTAGRLDRPLGWSTLVAAVAKPTRLLPKSNIV